MFYDDHNPPHFHVEYQGYKISVNLKDEVVEGFMPKRALKLIFEWMEIHKEELMENWKRCKKGDKPNSIDPLI